MAGRWSDLAHSSYAKGPVGNWVPGRPQHWQGAMSIPWVAKHTLLIARLITLQTRQPAQPQQKGTQAMQMQDAWPVRALTVQALEAVAGFAKSPWAEMSGVKKGLSAAMACLAVIVPAEDLR
jgi:hypothetical protein